MPVASSICIPKKPQESRKDPQFRDVPKTPTQNRQGILSMSSSSVFRVTDLELRSPCSCNTSKTGTGDRRLYRNAVDTFLKALPP